ncbi:Alkaline phosphatase synthesis transcriptional regulatory protein PhoP [Lacunisphaera limnophila]|uniref:Alkaline phosphatase synthesis transcriptional regulatory protein PhoP n=1 Tax=Lacunisphaera limnophila TaxID=1838286 RepID=A0A1D8AR33_9BACT|nr:response regulator [Lacunisphaera limnophila]AOS43347.1 Alkaline phosphatase synthesis transcriptional regulatory protein PhoP [Lacunisphaera limnophila]
MDFSPAPAGRAGLPVTPLDVLFVDDDREIASVMSEYLRRSGYQVESAADGEVALKILHRRAVAVVVTDIQMPQLDGYELIMKLRESPFRPRIIAMSGNPSKIGLDFLKSAQQLGADRVLPKPFVPQSLLKLVAEILGPRPPVAANNA